MRCVVVDRVGRDSATGIIRNWVSGIEIAIESGEVAATDLDPDGVPNPEQV
jgi:hypothetical protein